MDDEPTTGSRRDFNLAERTAQFGEAAIQFARGFRRDDVSGPLIRQLVRAATSIGSNYTEADEAGSSKEFRYRISICCREARETQYWLRMLAAASPDKKTDARTLWQEANELTRIFGAIHRRSKPSSK
ncbi:MAG: four helix bundle protein [Planctomycetota bacterium]|nr:MAG: four helix bundle protein [Planctomycetota bacterium]